MSQGDANMYEEAAGWFLRQRDPACADWVGFIAWLEASPMHNAAYEAVALADDTFERLLGDIRPAETPSNDNLPFRGRMARRWMSGLGGVAAIAIAVLIGYPMLAPAVTTYAIETGAGQHRMVTLDDGTRIALNGDSKLTLRRDDPRFATLDAGEATFTVVHNPDAPFEVHVGDTTLRDVGTVFNVMRSGGDTEASVAEGAVLFNPEADAIRLDAGKLIHISGSGSAVIAKIDPSAVGAWRRNRLVYQDASLSRIAADLSRNLGAPVTIAPELSHEHFSGVILLGDDRPHLFARIGTLLDVDAVQDGQTWHLVPRTSAIR